MVILIANIIGLFCTYGGVYGGMIVYSLFMISVTIGLITTGSYVSHYQNDIRQNVKDNFRRLWVIGGIEHYTTPIEKSFGCCGWSNVFDYCSGIYI